jgi:hypothetical protein
MIPQTSLRTALTDDKLLGKSISGPSWEPWRALMYAIMGEPLEPAELEHFRRLTRRQNPPTQRVHEFWGVIGRRAGKTRTAAVLAVYLATLCKTKLAPGESAVVFFISMARDQAKYALDYAHAALEESPILSKLIKRRTSETLELTNRVTLDVRSASYRRLRGQTALAVIADEVAFWFDEASSTNPDTEILGALRPSLLTTRGPLIVISSPHARKGALWTAHQRYFGVDNPQILVAQGESRSLNATLTEEEIAREYEKDAQWASAEYGAQFRTDVETFLTLEAVEACIDPGVYERPYNRQFSYSAFVDPSGGLNDSFTLAIAHMEGKIAVSDVIREVRAPFSPEAAVEQHVSLLRAYSINTVRGDKYGGLWPQEQFTKRGVNYEPSERSKSQIYGDLLPLVNSRGCALLDHDVMKRQMISLERRAVRAGRDSIDHPKNLRDDVSNAVAGALTHAPSAGCSDPNFYRRIEYPPKGIV